MALIAVGIDRDLIVAAAGVEVRRGAGSRALDQDRIAAHAGVDREHGQAVVGERPAAAEESVVLVGPDLRCRHRDPCRR